MQRSQWNRGGGGGGGASRPKHTFKNRSWHAERYDDTTSTHSRPSDAAQPASNFSNQWQQPYYVDFRVPPPSLLNMPSIQFNQPNPSHYWNQWNEAVKNNYLYGAPAPWQQWSGSGDGPQNHWNDNYDYGNNFDDNSNNNGASTSRPPSRQTSRPNSRTETSAGTSTSKAAASLSSGDRPRKVIGSKVKSKAATTDLQRFGATRRAAALRAARRAAPASPVSTGVTGSAVAELGRQSLGRLVAGPAGSKERLLLQRCMMEHEKKKSIVNRFGDRLRSLAEESMAADVLSLISQRPPDPIMPTPAPWPVCPVLEDRTPARQAVEQRESVGERSNEKPTNTQQTPHSPRNGVRPTPNVRLNSGIRRLSSSLDDKSARSSVANTRDPPIETRWDHQERVDAVRTDASKTKTDRIGEKTTTSVTERAPDLHKVQKTSTIDKPRKRGEQRDGPTRIKSLDSFRNNSKEPTRVETSDPSRKNSKSPTRFESSDSSRKEPTRIESSDSFRKNSIESTRVERSDSSRKNSKSPTRGESSDFFRKYSKQPNVIGSSDTSRKNSNESTRVERSNSSRKSSKSPIEVESSDSYRKHSSESTRVERSDSSRKSSKSPTEVESSDSYRKHSNESTRVERSDSSRKSSKSPIEVESSDSYRKHSHESTRVERSDSSSKISKLPTRVESSDISRKNSKEPTRIESMGSSRRNSKSPIEVESSDSYRKSSIECTRVERSDSSRKNSKSNTRAESSKSSRKNSKEPTRAKSSDSSRKNSNEPTRVDRSDSSRKNSKDYTRNSNSEKSRDDKRRELEKRRRELEIDLPPAVKPHDPHRQVILDQSLKKDETSLAKKMKVSESTSLSDRRTEPIITSQSAEESPSLSTPDMDENCDVGKNSSRQFVFRFPDAKPNADHPAFLVPKFNAENPGQIDFVFGLPDSQVSGSTSDLPDTALQKDASKLDVSPDSPVLDHPSVELCPTTTDSPLTASIGDNEINDAVSERSMESMESAMEPPAGVVVPPTTAESYSWNVRVKVEKPDDNTHFEPDVEVSHPLNTDSIESGVELNVGPPSTTAVEQVDRAASVPPAEVERPENEVNSAPVPDDGRAATAGVQQDEAQNVLPIAVSLIQLQNEEQAISRKVMVLQQQIMTLQAHVTQLQFHQSKISGLRLEIVRQAGRTQEGREHLEQYGRMLVRSQQQQHQPVPCEAPLVATPQPPNQHRIPTPEPEPVTETFNQSEPVPAAPPSDELGQTELIVQTKPKRKKRPLLNVVKLEADLPTDEQAMPEEQIEEVLVSDAEVTIITDPASPAKPDPPKTKSTDGTKRKKKLKSEQEGTKRKKMSPKKAALVLANNAMVPSLRPVKVVWEFLGHTDKIVKVKIFKKYLFSCSVDGTARQFKLMTKTTTPECVMTYAHQSCTPIDMDVAVLSDSNKCLLVASTTGGIQRFSLETGGKTGWVATKNSINCFAYKWNMVYVGDDKGDVTLFKVSNLTMFKSFNCSPSPVRCLATTAEGGCQILCTGCEDGTVTLRDARSGLLLRCLGGDTRSPLELIVSNQFVLGRRNTGGDFNRDILIHSMNGEYTDRINQIMDVTGISVDGEVLYMTSRKGLVRGMNFFTRKSLPLYYGVRGDPITAILCQNELIITGNVSGGLEAFQIGDGKKVFTCKFGRCKNPFIYHEDLVRHVELLHVCPPPDDCMVEGCRASFKAFDGKHRDKDVIMKHILAHLDRDN